MHPVRGWHLVLLPPVLAANYALLVVRHECSHAVVALAFEAQIAEVHLWPPQAANLSWIVFRLPLHAPALAVPLQAVAPYVLAVVLLASGLFLVGWKLPGGIVRANVAVTAVLVPCAELIVNVVAYWYGAGDFFYVFGTDSTAARLGVTAFVAAAVAFSGWVLGARMLSDRAVDLRGVA